MEALAPFVPLCEKLGRLAQGLGNGSVDRIAAEFRGRIAEHDTRLLGIAVLVGILSGHTEEQVNLVNAPALAEERGIELTELKDAGLGRVHGARHGADRVGRRHGRGRRAPRVGPRNLPHLVRVWGESFYMPFAEHLVVFRYKDQPGMIGRVGTIFGEHGVNIVSAAVGRGGVGRRGRPGAHHRRPGAARAARGDPAARGLPRRPGGRLLAGLSANEDAGVGSGRCARSSSPSTGRPRCSRSRSARTRRCGPARCGSRSRRRGSTSPTRWRASGCTRTRPSCPCVVGYEVAGEVESVGDGVESATGRAIG